MKKFFKKLLCMSVFAVLTVICAHADNSVLVIDQLTPQALPLLEDKQNVDIYLGDDKSRTFQARVELFDKHERYAVLSVDTSMVGKIKFNSYWFRASTKDSTATTQSAYILDQELGTVRQIASFDGKIKAISVINPVRARRLKKCSDVAPLDLDPSSPPPDMYFGDSCDDDFSGCEDHDNRNSVVGYKVTLESNG
ncbi:MAG: hypothetical protein IKE41_00090, partial [Clostridia bacterium]|nr:hypothetical protein [Clostridia bacterium]